MGKTKGTLTIRHQEIAHQMMVRFRRECKKYATQLKNEMINFDPEFIQEEMDIARLCLMQSLFSEWTPANWERLKKYHEDVVEIDAREKRDKELRRNDKLVRQAFLNQVKEYGV